MGDFPVFVWEGSEAGQVSERFESVIYEQALGLKCQQFAGAWERFPQDVKLFGILGRPGYLTLGQQFHQEVAFLPNVVRAFIVRI